MREGFHDAFMAALAGDTAALRPWSDAQDLEARLSVYRNTMAKGRADALIAQFPTVLKLVGEAWLGNAAIAHAGASPPTTASLLDYGQAFPAWLETFPPAAAMPYLADVARLDLAWTAAHLAADAETMAPAALAALTPQDFARHRLALHPAARFAWFGAAIPSLWLAMQADPPPTAFEVGDAPEGLLFVRPQGVIEPLRIGAGVHALLAACRDGESLTAAATAALAAEPGLPLSHAFADLLGCGAFACLIPLEAT